MEEKMEERLFQLNECVTVFDRGGAMGVGKIVGLSVGAAVGISVGDVVGTSLGSSAWIANSSIGIYVRGSL